MTFSSNQDDWDDSLLMSSLMTAVNNHKQIRNGQAMKTTQPPKKRQPNSTEAPKKQKKSRLEEFEDALCMSHPLPDMAEDMISPTEHSASADCVASVPSSSSSAAPTSSLPASSLLDASLQEMLLSWYNSGYYTGRYEVLRELEQLGIAIPPHMLTSSSIPQSADAQDTTAETPLPTREEELEEGEER